MKSDFNKYFLIIMSFVFLGYLVNAYINKKDTRQQVTSEGTVEKCSHNDFVVSDVQWTKGQYAMTTIDSITITNKGDYDCKDIRGVMRFLSNEGTELDKIDFVISEKIRSKETKTFKSIPLKQHTSVSAHDASVSIGGAMFHTEMEGQNYHQ